MTQDPTSIPGKKSTRREACSVTFTHVPTAPHLRTYKISRSWLGFYFKEKELFQVKMIRGP